MVPETLGPPPPPPTHRLRLQLVVLAEIKRRLDIGAAANELLSPPAVQGLERALALRNGLAPLLLGFRVKDVAQGLVSPRTATKQKAEKNAIQQTTKSLVDASTALGPPRPASGPKDHSERPAM